MTTLIPGMLTFEDYVDRRKHYDPMLQCISLDGKPYKGKDVYLFPETWLDRAHDIADALTKAGKGARMGKAIGVDAAEGGDNTSWANVDELGLIELLSEKTPDTNVIPKRTVDFANRNRVPAEYVLFDRGGGGKQHADRLRAMGWACRTVAFGESVTQPIKGGITTLVEKREHAEEKYIYKNRRAEMYGDLSDLLNPNLNPRGFGIPRKYKELRRQLKVIPRWYDEEGRLYLPPKQLRSDQQSVSEQMQGGSAIKKVTMMSLLGCSPDEADALVLAVHGLLHKPPVRTAGAAW